ncbi:MAG: hypothetical protein RL621_2161 [Bacteroidota bacterium]|jgi:hypothetical protein
MEVHHHSHHPKKWKEYLTEFFMLFAAVSLGFLAENLREGYVEKERSHELVSSFIKDVELNVQFLDSLIKGDKKHLLKCDSTALYIIKTQKDIDLEYVYDIPLHSFRYLSNNDTYDQMKSSGSLRYIKDTTLLRKMIEYSNLSKATEFRSVVQEYDYTANEFQNVLNKYKPIEIAANYHAKQILNYGDRYIKDSIEKTFFIETAELKKGKIFLLPNEKINQFKADVVPVIYRRTSLIMSTMNFMYGTRNEAIELLKYYKEHNEH